MSQLWCLRDIAAALANAQCASYPSPRDALVLREHSEQETNMAPKPERPTREGNVRTESKTSLVDYVVYDEHLLPHQNADGLDVSTRQPARAGRRGTTKTSSTTMSLAGR